MIAFPSNPDIGDFHTYAKRTWVWNGNAWQSSNYRPDGAIVADTPPSNPESGWLWWDRINAKLYTWTGSQWIEPNTNFPIGDPDIWNYVLQVEGIDGQPLETGVVAAYGNFITGLKTDGLWDAVKASCILAGARTLDAALIPLAGAAPTNFNFTPEDYDRKTGLKGDGSGKYLNSNRSNAADPYDSKHIFSYLTEKFTLQRNQIPIGRTGTGGSFLMQGGGKATYFAVNSAIKMQYDNGAPYALGGLGASRSTATHIDYIFRNDGIGTAVPETGTIALNAVTNPVTANICVFNDQGFAYGIAISDARLSFYSIGEAIDLVKLDARVTSLMSDLNAAIV
jgi:hypothetical protein